MPRIATAFWREAFKQGWLPDVAKDTRCTSRNMPCYPFCNPTHPAGNAAEQSNHGGLLFELRTAVHVPGNLEKYSPPRVPGH